MRRKKMILGCCCLLMAAGLISFAPQTKFSAPGDIEGAWEIAGNPRKVALLIDGYFTVTVFRQQAPEFISTMGGTFSYEGSMISGRSEERRVGKECVGTCRSRRWQYH